MFRKKIIPFVTAFAMAFSLAVVPVKAAVDPGTVITGIGTVVSLGQLAISSYELWRDLNPDADESEYTGFNPGGTFGAYEDVGGSRDEYFAAAYATYVSDLDYTNITSDGYFEIIPKGWAPVDHPDTFFYEIEDTATGFEYTYIGSYSGNHSNVFRAESFVLPAGKYVLYCNSPDGVYMFSSTFCYLVDFGGVASNWCKVSGTGLSGLNSVCSAEFTVTDSKYLYNGNAPQDCYPYIDFGASWPSAEGSFLFDYKLVCTYAADDVYSQPANTSRPTSITGNYGIVGDDGSVTNIGTQTIVNEGDSTYYNPVTNTSYDLSGWTYDYSTRTYDLSTTEGDTITVEYGDETVNITEGDTVYNIYYLVEEDTSSGDDDESTGDEDCDHSYTSETTKAATCLLAGKETFTCSECGDTYTKAIPATGHDWSVLQSVTSQYDDTGALVTEGYTIYQCSSCGEQYKSTDGSAPPGGSSSSGGTIWEKIGTLFGTIADGVIGMIETAISTLLDGLISLATVISEKGQRVVELILGFFEKIPELFGAFPDFLGAVFPFIPDDILLIIEFGLAAVVFAAIIKFFKKG